MQSANCTAEERSYEMDIFRTLSAARSKYLLPGNLFLLVRKYMHISGLKTQLAGTMHHFIKLIKTLLIGVRDNLLRPTGVVSNCAQQFDH